jgi:hypothetical protein
MIEQRAQIIHERLKIYGREPTLEAISQQLAYREAMKAWKDEGCPRDSRPKPPGYLVTHRPRPETPTDNVSTGDVTKKNGCAA